MSIKHDIGQINKVRPFDPTCYLNTCRAFPDQELDSDEKVVTPVKADQEAQALRHFCGLGIRRGSRSSCFLLLEVHTMATYGTVDAQAERQHSPPGPQGRCNSILAIVRLHLPLQIQVQYEICAILKPCAISKLSTTPDIVLTGMEDIIGCRSFLRPSLLTF